MRGRRKRASAPSLMSLGTDLAMLGVEAQIVIGQRLAMLMLGGPAARTEARRMVSEKVRAAGEAAMTLATGGGPDKVVRDYRRKVRANAKRLGTKR